MFRIIFTAAVSLLAAGAAVQAQQQPASAFDGYRPFTEAPVAPWKDTNRQVLEAGGWRAYARGANAAASAPAVPAAPAIPSTQPASAPAAHKH